MFHGTFDNEVDDGGGAGVTGGNVASVGGVGVNGVIVERDGITVLITLCSSIIVFIFVKGIGVDDAVVVVELSASLLVFCNTLRRIRRRRRRRRTLMTSKVVGLGGPTKDEGRVKRFCLLNDRGVDVGATVVVVFVAAKRE
jgi:hypothetical protein